MWHVQVLRFQLYLRLEGYETSFQMLILLKAYDLILRLVTFDIQNFKSNEEGIISIVSPVSCWC
jgi:hypothetical protein